MLLFYSTSFPSCVGLHRDSKASRAWSHALVLSHLKLYLLANHNHKFKFNPQPRALSLRSRALENEFPNIPAVVVRKLYFPCTLNRVIMLFIMILKHNWRHGSEDNEISSPQDKRNLQVAAVRVWWCRAPVVAPPGCNSQLIALDSPCWNCPSHLSSASSGTLVKIRPLGSLSLEKRR